MWLETQLWWWRMKRFARSSVTENPQQDKKSLLCIRETDGKSAVLDTFKDGSYVLLMILIKLHNVVSLFSAPVRIPHGTTGPTDWLWPNSVRPTSPSCLCCSKVTGSVACEVFDVNDLNIKSLNTSTFSYAQTWHSSTRAIQTTWKNWSILRNW